MSTEKGNAKNVSRFRDLIKFCEGYKKDYNPSRLTIGLENLKALHLSADLSLKKVTDSETGYKNAVNARQELFKDLKKLATRITNSFDSSDASDEAKKDIKSINGKLQGKRVGKLNTPSQTDNTPSRKNISVSQLSYDLQIEHFKSLNKALEAEPAYKPNEADLQVAQITELISQMDKVNDDVSGALSDISNQRLTRNIILYEAKTGLYDIAQDVKKYIKSVFGATSPQFRQVSKISFTTIA